MIEDDDMHRLVWANERDAPAPLYLLFVPYNQPVFYYTGIFQAAVSQIHKTDQEIVICYCPLTLSPLPEVGFFSRC